MKRTIFLFLPILIMTTFMSCSGSNPVQGTNPSAELPGYELNGVAVAKTGVDTWRGVMGAIQVIVDTDNLTAEVIPFRSADAIGDVFNANLTEYLIFKPCKECMRIGGLGLASDDTVSISLQVRHPFSNLLSRPDLHVFDVRGIVLAPGAITFPDIKADVDGDGNATDIIQTNPSFVVNADGYTTQFDDSTLGNYFVPPLNYSGNLNPFKNFFIDSDAGTFDPFQPKGHNVMPVNSAWDTQIYQFYKPSGGTLTFTFLTEASYGQSAKKFTRNDPQYYLPEFNRKEAHEVKAELYDDELEEGTVTSTANIRVWVKDWQSGRSKDDSYPDPNNLTGLSQKSDVDQVEISCPDFSYFEVKSRLQSEPGGTGSDGTPYLFEFGPITTGALTAGDYYGLIAVRDDLCGHNGPLPLRHKVGETFPHDGPIITDYTAYQILKITVRTPGTLGCPVGLVPFNSCNYTIAIGALQNPNDTVVGVGSSTANLLDIDYGIKYPTWDIFALEQGGVLGAGLDTGSGGFIPFRAGEPGYRVGSIDVDSQNRVVFSASQLGFTPGPVSVTDRNTYATDTFYVWLLTELPATKVAQVDIDPMGSSRKVIAIETDWNDDVWLIDSDNYLHKYLAGENYTEDEDAGFDLTEVFPALPNPAAFQGQVFDLVANFYNRALFILTDHDPKGTLYRIECDGTYYPYYSGVNPNPVHNVLFGSHNGCADIIIDNYDINVDQLRGPQDCQIIIAGGKFDGFGNDYQGCLYITRINSQLSNPRYSVRDYGTQCMAIDPIRNMLRIVHGGPDGNQYFSIHQPPIAWE